VSANLPRTELGEEDNLLVEAVSLLVQRQHETESRVAEQLWQAEERTAATERRYAELEARLASIEEQLERVVHEVEPARGDAASDERLARLREQLEGLKSGGDGRPARSATPAALTPGQSVPLQRPVADAPAGVSQPRARTSANFAAGLRARPQPSQPPQSVSFWDLLGSSPQDRFGLVFIGVGAVAVLYAALSLLRGG